MKNKINARKKKQQLWPIDKEFAQKSDSLWQRKLESERQSADDFLLKKQCEEKKNRKKEKEINMYHIFLEKKKHKKYPLLGIRT